MNTNTVNNDNTKNITEITKLREDVYEAIKENQKNITSSHNSLKDYLENKINNFDDIFEKLYMKIAEIQNTNITSKLKIEKIDSLQKFKENTSEQLTNLNNNYIKLQEDYNKSCNKYDKIYIDNLDVPGIVGDYCKYKNLREYIEVNLIYIKLNT